ncbi:MAG: hypothetical protein RLZZ584_2331 [Pseudomonadota bacterium]
MTDPTCLHRPPACPARHARALPRRLALCMRMSVVLMLALPLVAGLTARPARADQLAAPVVQTGAWQHALSAFEPPKYPPGFRHFDYVDPGAPKGGVLRLSNPDRRTSYDKLNPFTIKGVAPAAMVIFVFETLATYSMDERQAMYGLLAEAMHVEPDLAAVSFRLHPLARFSDGSPVTAEDVAHSFRLQKGKLVQPTFQSPLEGVAAATVVDARTVRFTLRDRRADVVYALGNLAVFSRRWTGDKPLDQIVGERPIASGPYVVDKVEMPGRLELRRNPDYWARDLPVRRGHFNFDRIVYRLYKDPAVRREAFKAGEFDILRELSASQYVRSHQGPKWRDGRIVKRAFPIATGSLLQAMDFNLRRARFQDIRVREAIMLAWDFEAYNRYGRFTRADSLFSNTDFAAEGPPTPAELALLEPFRAELPATVFGPAFRAPRNDTHPGALREHLRRAAALLAEAGWKVAPDGVLRNAAGEAFTIEYLEPQQIGRNTEFQHNLARLGIRYTERLVDFALYRRRLENFDYDMITIVEGKFTLPDPADLLQIYGSGEADRPGSYNFRGVKSRAVDELIRRIGRAATLDELRSAARALDRVVMWNHWQVPQLYTRDEPSSYWNRFGVPAVQARYMQIDSLPDVHSLPWPLWTWWDRSLDTRGAPAGAAPASAAAAAIPSR